MGFDGSFLPKHIPSGGSQPPAQPQLGAQAMDQRPQVANPQPQQLIPMGPGINPGPGINGMASFNAPPPNLEKELATLEALRRSQADLMGKSERFQGSSPKAKYLFTMAQSLVDEDINRREETLNAAIDQEAYADNIFKTAFQPRKDGQARSLI